MKTRFEKKSVVLFAVLIGALFVIAVIITIYLPKRNTIDNTFTVNDQRIQKIVAETVSADTDGDGLKDWEEVLFKTDPKNPDTDGDGTTDKEEIDRDRDPLVAGPNDIIENNLLSTIKNETVTESLAIELFTGYLELKKSKDLNTIKSEELLSKVISGNIENTKVKIYSVNDIHVIQHPGKEEVDQYDVQLTTILKPDPEMKNDLAILEQILKTKDTSGVISFDRSINRYEKIVSEMLLLPVPEPISIEHIKTTNALVRVIDNVRSMRNVFVDPVRTLVGVKEYVDNERVFVQSLLAVGEYLRQNRALNN
ncbi:hypothetical protein HYW58_01150 [Candidatus Kaiserbacteria bacterium]|nr:hypothetical protein [Candidatus Kaiserbacteria bacterium]